MRSSDTSPDPASTLATRDWLECSIAASFAWVRRRYSVRSRRTAALTAAQQLDQGSLLGREPEEVREIADPVSRGFESLALLVVHGLPVRFGQFLGLSAYGNISTFRPAN